MTLLSNSKELQESAAAQRLARLLDDLVAKKSIHHAVLAVESVDGDFAWSGAAGVADASGAPMRVETPYFIASIDKLYNAVILMRLRERGLVALDEPVTAYLPNALTAGLHRLGGTDHSGEITVRHLLSHTSGLPDWLEDRPKGGQSLVERLVEAGDMPFSLEQLAEHVRERLTPYFPPQPADARRPKARYSDTNYMLLCAIIEAVSGKPLHEAWEEMLLRPLGLRQTYLFGHSQPLDPAPAAAALWAGDRLLEIPQMLRSLQAVYSTAGDTIKFLRALVRGEIFDSPGSFALMQQRWNRFGLPLDMAALRSPNWPIEYGLGMMRFRLPRIFTPFHPIPAVIGHTGSTGTWLFHCPDPGLLLAGAVDQVTAGPVPFRLAPKVLRLFPARSASKAVGTAR